MVAYEVRAPGNARFISSMIPTASAALTATLITYGYWAIFPIAVIEGPIVSIVAGFFVSTGHFGALSVFMLLVIADLVGDSMYYALGRFGGKHAIERWGSYVGVHEERIARFKELFDRHDWKVLFLGKASAVGSVILTAAGVAQMPYIRFMWLNLLGSTPKVLLFLGIGYFIGDSYVKADAYLKYGGIISTLVAIALVMVWIAIGGYVKKQTEEPPQSDA